MSKTKKPLRTTDGRHPMAVKGSELSETMTIEQLEKVMTLQQIEFARKYVLCLNAREAAEAVGYAEYRRLMVNPKIKLYVTKLQEQMRERFHLTADGLIQELCKIGFVNPADLYHDDGRLKRPQELPRNIAAAISEITEEMVGFDKKADKPLMKIKYKFHSKPTALDMLAKHLGLYERDNAQKNVARVVFTLPSNGRDPKLDAKREIIDITPKSTDHGKTN